MSKGASVDTYVRPEGELGTAHFDFKVAHKGGEPCPICSSTIERVLVQNRGTSSALQGVAKALVPKKLVCFVELQAIPEILALKCLGRIGT